MSSLYEQMISAAIDVQLANGGNNSSNNNNNNNNNNSLNNSNSSNGREHAFSYPPPILHNQHYNQLYSFASQMNGLTIQTNGAMTSDNASTTADGLVTVTTSAAATAATAGGGGGGGGGGGNQVMIVSGEKASEQMSSTSNNSSSATAITILTPEPTESASSSAGGSPRSLCSTLISEQVNDQMLPIDQENAERAITCAECANYFDGITRQPKILECIHTFCEPCLARRQIPFSGQNHPPLVCINCPLNDCGQETVIPTIAALQTNIPALTMSIVARAIQHIASPVLCGCMMNDAACLCFSCHQLICQNCLASSHSSGQHVIESLGMLNLNSIDTGCVARLVDRLRTSRASTPSVMCPRHPALPVFSYCETCSQPVCNDCTPNHFSTKVGDTVTIHLLKGFDAQTYKHECGFFGAYIKFIRAAVKQLRDSLDAVGKAHEQLQHQHHASNVAVYQQFESYVNKTANLHKLYAEQGDELLSGVALTGGLDKFMTDVDQLRDECRRLNTLFERARENCSAAEMSSLRDWVKRKVVDIRQRCRSINQSFSMKRRHSLPTVDIKNAVDAEFPTIFDSRPIAGGSNYKSSPLSSAAAAAAAFAAAAATSTMGSGFPPNSSQQSFNRFQTAAMSQAQFQPSATARNQYCGGRSSGSEYFPQVGGQQWQNGGVSMQNNSQIYQRLVNAMCNQPLRAQRPDRLSTSSSGSGSYGQFQKNQMLGSDMRSATLTPGSSGNSFDNSQNDEHDLSDGHMMPGDMDQQQMEAGVVTDSPNLIAPTSVAIPNRLQLRYIAKIGQFGESDGQFTEPSGIATNPQNQLVVADTNSHRIQVFNNHGAFLWRFGECGKRAGQVLYPNRIAIGPDGEYVFTERAPQCLVQVFDQHGGFIRRFGSGDLRHPRGLCIDREGHVLVLECQVMSVTIYDMRGTRLRRFTFEGVRFPSSICVNDQQEIFIADNIQHYVFVYNYEGVMKRRIGGYPTINFPVGVAINHLGQLVVADNHNNFNITVFTQDGTPISGYESCVKHAQVLDVCLLNGGRAVAISCKDYRVYVYPYATDAGSLMDATATVDTIA